MQPNTRLIILNYYTKEIVDAFTNHYQFFHSHSVNSCTTAQFTYQIVYFGKKNDKNLKVRKGMNGKSIMDTFSRAT